MRKERGFTLIELLVVLTVSAILLSLAAPSFSRLIRSTKMTGAVNSFMADMRFARTEAIRMGGTVTICRSSDSETTSASGPTCAGAGDWEGGWIVFRDQNNNASRDYNADITLDDRILRIQGPVNQVGSISTAAGNFQFTATGRLLTPGAAVLLTFGGSDYDASEKRYVCVNMSGRARIVEIGTFSCGSDS